MFQLILAFQLELPFEAGSARASTGPGSRARSRERTGAAKAGRARAAAESLPLAFESREPLSRE